jgi:hypothetical protein
MTPPDHNQGESHGSEEQAPATNNQERPAGRRSTRRRWIRAAGLAAVPLIITVKAQPAWAQGGKSHKSHYG